MSKGKILLILALIIAAIFLVVPLFTPSDKPQEYTLTITAQHCDVQVLNSKNKSVESLFEGQKYSIRVTPETGYEVTGIYSNGYRVNNHQITPTSDILLRVDTAIKTYQLALGEGVHVYDSKNFEVTTAKHFEKYTITAPSDGYQHYKLWLTSGEEFEEINSDIYIWTCDGPLSVDRQHKDFVKTTLSFAFPANDAYIYYTDYNANYVQKYNTQELSVYGFALPENYRFVGWATEPDSAEIAYGAHTEFKIPFETNPYILYAVIEPIIYTLNYWSMDGQTLLHSVSNHGPTELTLVDYEDYATINEGYYFRGWNFEPLVEYSTSLEPGENFVLDRNYDLYASVPQVNYNLTYYQQVEDFEPSTYFESHLYFEEFNLRPISEFQQVINGDFYNFLGWDTDPSADNVVYLDNQKVSKLTNYPSEVVLYAVWEPIIVTLSLYAPDETTLLYTNDFAGLKQTTTLPAYSSLVNVDTGKYFYNWKQLNGLNYYQDGAQVAMTNDISLAAVLKDLTYTVSLNTTTIYDDGVNEPIINTTEYSLPTCTYGQSYTLPLASTLAPFAKEGYKLIGWDTDSSADTVVYADGASFSNLTTTHNSVINLYAVYEVALPAHSKTFGENTPAQISAVSSYISENNLTTQQVYDTFGWSIGDSVSMSGFGYVYIIGFNHDDKSDGSGKAGITLFNYRNNTCSMSEGLVNKYSESDLHADFTEMNCFGKLPDAWCSVIVPVRKYASFYDPSVGAAYNNSDSELLSCNLFLLSRTELSGNVVASKTERLGERQYAYFSDGLYSSFGGWTRDAYSDNYFYRFSLNANGYENGANLCTESDVVHFAFCV